MHVVSTAGHVDHGKSTLIQRMTGIDPDRLVEEKERGLTIDLGFAWMSTPGGRELGFVDVPGHERFIHNMLAGVGSVDATLFVVAANEGWARQSEEHLQILEMLEARAAVIAITKADLVDHDALEEVFDVIRARLSGTPLAGSEVVAVSGTTGAGIPDLIAALDRMLDRVGIPPDRGRPRVFLDRTFTVQGVGTVVTGTLTGGSLKVDEAVEVLPHGSKSRVRAIQTHRRGRKEALPVSRVALNLPGIERGQLTRGDAVVLPGQWQATSEIDVLLRTVRSLDHELEPRGSYKVYVGAAEVDATIRFYEGDGLTAGQEGFARLRLGEPVVATAFDRFVLRDTGRRATVGGGIILDAHPSGRATDRRVEQLAERRRARPDDIPTLVVSERGVVSADDLAWLSGSNLPARNVIELRTLQMSQERYEETADAIRSALREAHAAEPLASGFARAVIRNSAGIDDARLFDEVAEAIADDVEIDGGTLRLAGHEVEFSNEASAARDAVLAAMASTPFTPPTFTQLADEYGDALVRALIDDGSLVRISDQIVFSADALEDAKKAIATAIERDGPMSASQIRQELETTRKYAIPLLEHLDQAGFTVRDGDFRSLA